MFDIGWDEMLFTAVVAIVVIGPKDMPTALRTAGRWIGKVRRVSGHFRAGLDAMIRQAEMEDMEKRWREQNEAIMQAHPALPEHDPPDGIDAPAPVSAEAAVNRGDDAAKRDAEPQLPLPPP